MSLGRTTEIVGEGAGYLAIPAAGRGAGILVLAPAGGLPAVAVDACERLAREGFVALAPDVEAPEEDGAGLGRARSKVDAAIERLFREHATAGRRVGALGLGRGALLALDAASRSRRIAAVTCVGGAPEAAEGEAVGEAGLDVPVLVVFGEEDEAVASGCAQDFESRLHAAGKPCDLRILPGVAGAFFDVHRADVYDAAASDAAWDAALARLRAELG